MNRIVIVVALAVSLVRPAYAETCFLEAYRFVDDGILPSSEPDIEFTTTTGLPESDLYAVVGGSLEQTTCGVGDGNASYNFPDASVTGGGLDPASRTTIEARLRVACFEGNQLGAFFQAFDGAYRYLLNFVPGGVKVPGSPDLEVALDVSQFHTYRLESPGGSSDVMLFIDGEFMGATTAPSDDLNGFNWGDGNSNNGNNADASWDYLQVSQGFIKDYRFSDDAILPSSDPDIEFNTTTGLPESDLYAVVSGSLEQTTCGVGDGRASYNFPDASITGGGFDSASRTTIEARLRVACFEGNQLGAFFQAFDGTYRYLLNFVPGGVKVPGSPDLEVTLDVSQFHTYRLESPGGSSDVMLFIDGELRGVTAAPSDDLNGFNWGDGNSNNGNNADASWDYLHVSQHSSPNDKIYWTEQGSGRIQRSDSDGAGIEDLVADLETPYGITIDIPMRRMYWCDGSTRKIQRANLDGSCVEDLVTSGISLPDGIDIDVDAGKMYWADRIGDKIQRANLDGSGVEDLVALDAPGDITLDTAGGKMYWTSQNTDEIARANLDGTGQESLISTMNPGGLALDTTGGKIYWTISGEVKRSNLDGSGEETLVSGLSSPREIKLDLDAWKMYWSDRSTGKIQRADLDGTDVEDLVAGLDDPHGIALDPTGAPSDVGEINSSAQVLRLFPNAPNPFKASTTINYVLPASDRIRLVVFDIAGREVRTLVRGEVKAAGRHAVQWDATDNTGRRVSSGVYFYRIDAPSFTETASAVLSQ
jgi:hypothetical protein